MNGESKRDEPDIGDMTGWEIVPRGQRTQPGDQLFEDGRWKNEPYGYMIGSETVRRRKPPSTAEPEAKGDQLEGVTVKGRKPYVQEDDVDGGWFIGTTSGLYLAGSGWYGLLSAAWHFSDPKYAYAWIEKHRDQGPSVPELPPNKAGRDLPDNEGHWTRYYDNDAASGAPAYWSVITRVMPGHCTATGLLWSGWESTQRKQGHVDQLPRGGWRKAGWEGEREELERLRKWYASEENKIKQLTTALASANEAKECAERERGEAVAVAAARLECLKDIQHRCELKMKGHFSYGPQRMYDALERACKDDCGKVLLEKSERARDGFHKVSAALTRHMLLSIESMSDPIAAEAAIESAYERIKAAEQELSALRSQRVEVIKILQDLRNETSISAACTHSEIWLAMDRARKIAIEALDRLPDSPAVSQPEDGPITIDDIKVGATSIACRSGNCELALLARQLAALCDIILAAREGQ